MRFYNHFHIIISLCIFRAEADMLAGMEFCAYFHIVTFHGIFRIAPESRNVPEYCLRGDALILDSRSMINMILSKSPSSKLENTVSPIRETECMGNATGPSQVELI